MKMMIIICYVYDNIFMVFELELSTEQNKEEKQWYRIGSYILV